MAKGTIGHIVQITGAVIDVAFPAGELPEIYSAVEALPEALGRYDLELTNEGQRLIYTYDTQAERTGITSLLADLNRSGIAVRDLETSSSSLEDIFVSIVRDRS